MNTFMACYGRHLKACMQEFPNEYMAEQTCDDLLARMRPAIQRGTFNKDSTSFKRTCKELKIPHTYKAITHFIANHV